MRKRHNEYSRQLIDFVRELRPPAPIAGGRNSRTKSMS
jgi:hypothetical protein